MDVDKSAAVMEEVEVDASSMVSDWMSIRCVGLVSGFGKISC